MKNKKLINSFKFAFKGIGSSIRSERNMKIHFTMMILVVLAGIILNISMWEWITCFILFGLVISLEMVNTAIEIVVDLVSPTFNDRAGRAKDIAAGAVLVNAIVAFIIGLLIFLPKVLDLFIKWQIYMIDMKSINVYFFYS